MINKNHFFIISRTPLHDSSNDCTKYFKQWEYQYDKDTMEEIWGDESWFEDIKMGTKFPSNSYYNCKSFFRHLQHDYRNYIYEIILYKYQRSKIVPIKTFFNSTEDDPNAIN